MILGGHESSWFCPTYIAIYYIARKTLGDSFRDDVRGLLINLLNLIFAVVGPRIRRSRGISAPQKGIPANFRP